MPSGNQYLKVLRGEHFKVKTKKQKSQILDEYCGNTVQARKCALIAAKPLSSQYHHQLILSAARIFPSCKYSALYVIIYKP